MKPRCRRALLRDVEVNGPPSFDAGLLAAGVGHLEHAGDDSHGARGATATADAEGAGAFQLARSELEEQSLVAVELEGDVSLGLVEALHEARRGRAPEPQRAGRLHGEARAAGGCDEDLASV